MILTIDSDAAYLVMPKARSRIAGHFRFLDHPDIVNRDLYNGAIHIECKTLRHVVSLAAEAETSGVLQNAKIALPLRHILIAIGHPQPPTIISTDNSTSHGFCNNNIQLKRSKSWDMNLHWLRDRETKKQFKILLNKGIDNTADYFTKTSHTTLHHRQKRPLYIRDMVNALFCDLKNICRL